MKKKLFIIVLSSSISLSSMLSVCAHEAYVTPHTAYTMQHTGYTAVQKKAVAASTSGSVVNVYPAFRPVCRRSGAVLSSGVNFISRDIATGEVKQVVQVSSPRAYAGACYY